MTHQELELWVRGIVSSVLKNQHSEDSRVELKSTWPAAEQAAEQLAAHANAARGAPILWLVGIDEKAQRVSSADLVELANWFKSVERFFDGNAPTMLLNANVTWKSETVVALYFETHQGAPFVIKNPKGGYPQFIVPWREGNSKRAASRNDLLRVLVPIRRLSALFEELNYNLEVVHATSTQALVGYSFRRDEFDKVMADGTLATLSQRDRKIITIAYLEMNRANDIVSAAISSLALATTIGDPLGRAQKAVHGCKQRIDAALEALSRALRSN